MASATIQFSVRLVTCLFMLVAGCLMLIGSRQERTNPPATTQGLSSNSDSSHDANSAQDPTFTPNSSYPSSVDDGHSDKGAAPTFAPFQPSPDQAPLAGLENLFQVSDRIFSGGEPHGEAAFASIAKLGCKTIVSFDGSKPNLALAEKYGLKYVHILIGYDGLPREAQLAIVQVVRTAEAPFYFHCHHGKHRGPAAAAIGLISETKCDTKTAIRFLEAVGTSRDYPGLWRDVEQFKLPDPAEALPTLVAVAEVDTLVESMASLDRAFDHLKLCREADWNAPADHPDLVPLSLAVMVREAFKESHRISDEDWSDEFLTWLEESVTLASELESGLRDEKLELTEQAFQSLIQGCVQCHQKYRN